MQLRPVALILLWSAAISATASAAEPTRSLPLVPPQYVSCPDLNWPGMRDREAQVVLRLAIDRAGNVVDTVIVDGFYEPRHALAANRSVKRCRFKPAMRGGEPEDFDGYLYSTTFVLRDSGGMTRGFRSQLAAANQLVRSGDIDAAHVHVQHMLADEVKTLYEFAFLHAALAESFEATGNLQDALFNSRRATQPLQPAATTYLPARPVPDNDAANYRLPREMVVAQLRRRIAIDAKLGFVGDALEAWGALVGLELPGSTEDLSKLIGLLQARLADPVPFEGKARVRSDGTWSHVAYRPIFTVADVRGGALRRISIACGRFRRVLDYQPNVDWTLPRGAARCSLTFEGDPGTEFTIVEADVP